MHEIPQSLDRSDQAPSADSDNSVHYELVNKAIPAWLLNTSVTWYSPGENWSVQAWGKNLNDALYYAGRSEQGGLGDAQRQAPPRTYGVTLRVKF